MKTEKEVREFLVEKLKQKEWLTDFLESKSERITKEEITKELYYLDREIAILEYVLNIINPF